MRENRNPLRRNNLAFRVFQSDARKRAFFLSGTLIFSHFYIERVFEMGGG
jgi:hypothetical protein